MSASAAIAPPPAPARVTVRGVSKRFGGRAAIEDVSFDVRAGELVAVLGSSGAGKTTLIRCIAGLTTPDEGEIEVAGESARRRRTHIAVVYQQFNLVRRLDALDNVLAGRLGHVPAWRGITRRFEREDTLRALRCLARVGLVSQAWQRADTLSGGQQQRVAIARALAQEPDVIVADEPIASLDPHISVGILDLLRGIARRDGVAIVCSLHQLHFAREYADRIVGLAHGRLVVDVPAKAFDDRASSMLYGSAGPSAGDL